MNSRGINFGGEEENYDYIQPITDPGSVVYENVLEEIYGPSSSTWSTKQYIIIIIIIFIVFIM